MIEGWDTVQNLSHYVITADETVGYTGSLVDKENEPVYIVGMLQTELAYSSSYAETKSSMEKYVRELKKQIKPQK